MKIGIKINLCLLIIILLFIPTSSAEKINITANSDTYVYQAYGTMNYGIEDDLILYNHSGSNYELYLNFSVPGGLKVSSARVYIYENFYTDADTFILKNVSAGWSETGLTWNNKPSDGTFSSSTPYGYAWITIDVTNLVRYWTNNQGNVFGVHVKGTTDFVESVFYSREWADASLRPFIYIETYTPPPPASCSATTGNFYVNMSCQVGIGTMTDGMNKSVNGIWYNNTAFFKNITLSAHAWSNGSFFAYNSSGNVLNNTPGTLNTRIPNNPVTISNISASYSIPAGSTLSIYTTSLDLDGDTPAFSTNATKGSINSGTGVFTFNSVLGDVGTYAWNITGNDGYGSTSTKNFTVTVIDYTPGIVTGLGGSTSNFWVNYSWSAGVNTDSFNVSYNGTWTNGSSATSINKSVGAHGFGNITIYGYNASMGILGPSVTASTRIPNNPVTISNISSTYTGVIGTPFSIYPTSGDADADTPTFATNANKGTFYANNGTFLWAPQAWDSGTYNWYINVNDGYGSTSTKNFTVTVNSTVPGQPLDIAATTGNFWVNTTWNVSINTDSFNISMNGTWMNGTTSTFMNSTNITPHAWHNMSVYGYNATSQVTGTAAVLNIQIPNNVPVIGITTISSGAIFQFETETITVNITDLDSDNQTVMIGLVYGGTGTEINYTAALIPNTTTYTYSIGIGGAGTYSVNVHTSDNYTNVSKSTGLSFVVNTIQTSNNGGSPPSGSSTPAATTTPIGNVTAAPTQLPTTLNMKDVSQSSAGQTVFNLFILGAAGMFILGTNKSSNQLKMYVSGGILMLIGTYGRGMWGF
jgi:hypothetical protein